jgi:hypothetical protein
VSLFFKQIRFIDRWLYGEGGFTARTYLEKGEKEALLLVPV